MKRVTKDDELTTILKKLTKKIEDTAVDVHEIRNGVKSVDRRLGVVDRRLSSLESDTKNIKQELADIKRNTEDLIQTTSEILTKMVTQEEFVILSNRVTTLEQDIKTS